MSARLSRIPLAFLAALLLMAAPAFAQKAAEEETITGTLVEIKQAGRNITLSIETAKKEKLEYSLTSRAEFQVTGPGDEGFLRQKQFISAQALLVNDSLFAKQFTVHMVNPKPKPELAKVPPAPGVSPVAWTIAGEIASRQKDKDYPDFETIGVRAGVKPVPVYLDKGFTVTVVASDADLAAVGSKVDIVGKTAGKSFLVSKATVTLAKPLKSEEYFAARK